MWFGLAKMALNAGTHIYKKRQETKMAMADAQRNNKPVKTEKVVKDTNPVKPGAVGKASPQNPVTRT